MKLYWTMPPGLKEHYRRELALYKTEFEKRNLQQAWRHLECAHILAQSCPRDILGNPPARTAVWQFGMSSYF